VGRLPAWAVFYWHTTLKGRQALALAIQEILESEAPQPRIYSGHSIRQRSPTWLRGITGVSWKRAKQQIERYAGFTTKGEDHEQAQ
jgi:hypothetical protein